VSFAIKDVKDYKLSFDLSDITNVFRKKLKNENNHNKIFKTKIGVTSKFKNKNVFPLNRSLRRILGLRYEQ